MDYKIADKIVLDLRAQKIIIDGEPFPYVVEKNTIQVLTQDDGMPGIRVTILADKAVEVVDVE